MSFTYSNIIIVIISYFLGTLILRLLNYTVIQMYCKIMENVHYTKQLCVFSLHIELIHLSVYQLYVCLYHSLM